MTNAVRLAHDPEDAPRPIDRSVKVSTAAAILDCDESLIRRLYRDKKLRGHTIGIRGIRIFLSSIEEYRNAQTQGHPDSDKPDQAPTTRRRRRQTAHHKEAMAHLKALGCL